ncbi:hypothetical protein R3P38DRAFT_2932000 [Favolaschia claudopus]|uniref:DUF6533 domain-containing protein n=1 Tax=Favolaschia claudopus TaxID=2862362 RepID=A0AAW0BSQ0_9AGAR
MLLHLLYDSLLQIEGEYRYIWTSRWTLIKCLYLWTRYAAILNGLISLANSTTCNKIATFLTVFGGLTISVTTMILMVRTYTLYERSKKLLLFFFALWFGVGGFMFWAVTKWIGVGNSSIAANSNFECWTTQDGLHSIGFLCYLSLLIGESVIVLLTLGIVIRRFSRDMNGLLQSLYRDGVWFYIAILPFTVATVAITLSSRPGLSKLLDSPLLTMHALLVCRMIIHAREIAAEEDRRASAVNRIFRERKMTSNVVVDISPDNQV